jgi:hypothetical protein
MSTSSASTVILGLGAELLMLGIATGVASLDDEVGTMMLVFMGGLLLIWIIHHTAITNAIPNLLTMGESVS